MKYFWAVFQMDVVIKRIFRFLIVKTTLKYVNIFERIEIAETIYQGEV